MRSIVANDLSWINSLCDFNTFNCELILVAVVSKLPNVRSIVFNGDPRIINNILKLDLKKLTSVKFDFTGGIIKMYPPKGVQIETRTVKKVTNVFNIKLLMNKIVKLKSLTLHASMVTQSKKIALPETSLEEISLQLYFPFEFETVFKQPKLRCLKLYGLRS